MAEIRPFAPEFSDQLLTLFERFHASRITRPMWEGFLNYSSPRIDLPSGLVLLAQQRVVGFLGTLYSERRIRGVAEILCNLSSWIVDDAHRASGIGLLRRALHSRDVTITCFSASSRVEAILRQLGFKDLEDTGCFFSIAHGLTLKVPSVSIVANREDIGILLKGECAELFRDHAYPHCRHLYWSCDRGECYVLYTIRHKRNVLPYAHIHFVSNRQVFNSSTVALVRLLARMHTAVGFLVERRFLEPGHRPGRFVYPLPLHRLYRSSALLPVDIDNLYTELPVLGI